MCGQTTLDDCVSYHLFPEGHPDYKPRESGHAPATVDNRFPRMALGKKKVSRKEARARRRMEAAGYVFLSPEHDWENEGGAVRAGGRPSRGTRKDKRLKKNKRGK